jgi:SNF2 family DNA or RNA helicase
MRDVISFVVSDEYAKYSQTQRAAQLLDHWNVYESVLAGIKAGDEDIINHVLMEHGVNDDFWRREPKDHQRAGLAFFLLAFTFQGLLGDAGHILLFDDMRTGKTKQAIDIARFLLMKKLIKGVILVVPNTIKRVWQNELYMDAPLYSMLSVIIKGTKAKKKKLWRSHNYFYIVNYEACRADKAELYEWAERKSPFLLVADEAHKLKNPKAQQTQAILGLKPAFSLFMTGTPVSTRPDDVFNMVDFVAPGLLGSSRWHFKERFGVKGGFQGKEIVGWENLDEVRRRLSKVSLRRRRRDVVFDETFYQDRYGELVGDQREAYVSLRDTLYAEFTSQDGSWTSVQVHSNLVKALRLYQITSGYLSSEAGEAVWFTNNWKLRELDDFIDDYLESIGKLVIWTRFVPPLLMLTERYKKHGALHIKGQMGDQATENMYRFQRDKSKKIMVAQVQTSVGLGFQPARFCVFWDKWSTPLLNQQARDRITGLENPVPITVISLITQDAVDERIEFLLGLRQQWAESVTGDINYDIKLPRMDKATLLYLLANPEEARAYEEKFNE